jgi:manganese/zinc/iron transport system permease protein
MNSLLLQIMAIACVTSIACVLPGTFLLLRGIALMSDAISHAILLGIVLMFLLVQRLDSWLLLLGAATAGVATVFCTQLLIQIKYIKKDAAIGLVFPFFFSLAVIIISVYARNVHLDSDMVLLGDIVFAPFNRLVIAGIDCGPYALWLMSVLVLFNAFFIMLFYKELTLATFDQQQAYIMGFAPNLLHYSLMFLTSITAVAAFDVVGSIVVVALMIVPAATAYLFSYQLKTMLIVGIMFACAASLAGYAVAFLFDVSIAGSMSTMLGIFFGIALCVAPKGIYRQSVLKMR